MEGTIGANGDACWDRRAWLNVCCACIEFLDHVNEKEFGADGRLEHVVETTGEAVIYLAEIHRLYSFTSKCWTDWRTGTGLTSSHDQFHYLVRSCACFRHVVMQDM